jgi:hypothetical protein
VYSSLCGRILKVGWKCSEVRNETYLGAINGLKRENLNSQLSSISFSLSPCEK